MQLFVLTGASRGLGLALARQLLAPDHVVLTIARRPDGALTSAAASAGCVLEQWALDLAHDVGVAARLEVWLRQRHDPACTSATLINNAGVLGSVSPIDRIDAASLAGVLRVNLEAPLLLASAFLRATRDWSAARRVLNISSGAGRRPIAGWAAYCASKAGLDHATRTMALDEAGQGRPAQVVSLAPGVIDTAMQVELRAADPTGFPELANFRQLKASGQLATPEAAAARVLAYLNRADFGIHPVADLRDT